MNAAAMPPKLTLRERADNAGTLAMGTLPLFKSGVLGPMSPMAAAAKRFASKRVVDEELHVQGLRRAEWVDLRGCEVRQQVHVGLFNRGESANGGAIKGESLFCCFFIECAGWNSEVLLGAGHIGKADISFSPTRL